MTDISALTAEFFLPLQGQEITCDTTLGPVTLVLESVKTHTQQDPAMRQSFTLTLRGPNDPLLPQSTYALSHDNFDNLPLFLSPFFQDDEGVSYEIIFN